MRLKERIKEAMFGGILSLSLGLCSFGAGAFAKPPVKSLDERPTFRSMTAVVDRGRELRTLWKSSDALWPPKDLYIRHFKEEQSLELWARHARLDQLTLVHRFHVCKRSGALGPKRVQGDKQVPEGFYRVNHINHDSDFHLSLGIDYPNAVDVARAAGDPPGGEIYIHGDCVTVGCVPLEDGPVELLFVAAWFAQVAGQEQIPVHFFPCKMTERRCMKSLKEHPRRQNHKRLWQILTQAYLEFERTARLPLFCIDDEPFYVSCPTHSTSRKDGR